MRVIKRRTAKQAGGLRRAVRQLRVLERKVRRDFRQVFRVIKLYEAVGVLLGQKRAAVAAIAPRPQPPRPAARHDRQRQTVRPARIRRSRRDAAAHRQGIARPTLLRRSPRRATAGVVASLRGTAPPTPPPAIIGGEPPDALPLPLAAASPETPDNAVFHSFASDRESLPASEAPPSAVSEKYTTPHSDPSPTPPPATPQLPSRAGFYFIFFVAAAAGAGGLSIYARYLQLLLGSAANAQTLIAILTLGGVALGAVICARHLHRTARPLLALAATQAAVAVIAIYFHFLWEGVYGWAVGFVMPNLQTALAAEWFRWFLAAVLVLPQAVLLGAAFPLAVAGLARITPSTPGNSVSLLFCALAAGAAVGLLVGWFWLVPAVGLPGALGAAALASVAVAVYAWGIGHLYNIERDPILPAPPVEEDAAGSTNSTRLPFETVLLLLAAATGFAVSAYATIWERMFALLVGAAEDTAVIATSVVAASVAVGCALIRRRADTHHNPARLLAFVQFAAAGLALWALFVHPSLHDFLVDLLAVIQRIDNNYDTFVAGVVVSAALLSAPAALCLGMALPLLAKTGMRRGGEVASARVYAATLTGAVVGFAFAIHIGLPQLGILLALVVAAVVNLSAGVVLLAQRAATTPAQQTQPNPRRLIAGSVAASIVVFATVAHYGKIAPQFAAANILYQQKADAASTAAAKVVFYEEGKNAAIALTERASERGTLRTLYRNGVASGEVLDTRTANAFATPELTEVHLGGLPLLYKPDAAAVANIGFGSGLVARTLLAAKDVRRVDNIETEREAVAAAMQMGRRTASVFADPRNYIVFNDARAVLANRANAYDLIVSQPPPAWVRGSAGLYGAAFYQQIARALVSDGVFVQWLPLHNTEQEIVASIVKAFAAAFGDMHFYLSNAGDLLIVATKQSALPAPSNAVFAGDDARQHFARYQLFTTADFRINYIGSRESLLPYFSSLLPAANSAYYPHVASRAYKAFFMQNAYALAGVATLPVPVFEMLGEEAMVVDDLNASPAAYLASRGVRARTIYQTRQSENGYLQRWLARTGAAHCALDPVEPSADGSEDANASPAAATATADQNTLVAISGLMTNLLPMTDTEKMTAIWELLQTDGCIARLLASEDTIEGVYAQFWRALALRDAATITTTAEALMASNAVDFYSTSGQVLLLATVAGYYQQEQYQKAVQHAIRFPYTSTPALQNASQIIAAAAAEKL